MGMHKLRPVVIRHPIPDPVERAIAEAFARKIVALRLKHQLSRLVVVQRTGINWKRIRALEEGRAAPGLHEVVKLAALYGMRHGQMIATATKSARSMQTAIS